MVMRGTKHTPMGVSPKGNTSGRRASASRGTRLVLRTHMAVIAGHGECALPAELGVEGCGEAGGVAGEHGSATLCARAHISIHHASAITPRTT